MEQVNDFHCSLFGFFTSAVVPYVDYDGVSFLELLTTVNRHRLEESLVGEKFFIAILVTQFWSSESSTLEDLGFSFDFNIPFGPLTLLEELIDHAIDRLELFSRVHLDLVQESPHAGSAASDLFWDTVKKTEFWRHEAVSALGFHDEHRLLLLGYLEIVLLQKVLGDADLDAASELEEGCARPLVEADVVDDVGSLGAVVSNDALTDEFIPAFLLEFCHQFFHELLGRRLIFRQVFVDLIVNVVNLGKNSSSGHEPRAIVDDECAARLIFVAGGFESSPDLHLHVRDVQRVLSVEKLWSMTELEHAGLRHGLLRDDIKDVVHGDAVLSVSTVDVGGVDYIFALMIDF